MPEKSESCRLRELHKEDMPALLALLQIFCPGMTDQRLVWNYFKNPSGTTKSILAYHENRLIGSLCAFPASITIKGHPQQAYIIGDVVRDPGYKGPALFAGMYKSLINSVKNNGVPDKIIFLGFPNEFTVRATKVFYRREGSPCAFLNFPVYKKPMTLFAKLYHPQDGIPRKALLSLTRPILNLIKPGPSVRGSIPGHLAIEQAGIFPEDHDEFWEMIKQDYPVLLTRSRDFLAWRYQNCPGVTHRIYTVRIHGKYSGYFILRTAKRDLIITDILLPRNPALFEEVLQYIIDFALHSQAENVRVILTYPPWQSLIENIGFRISHREHFTAGYPFNKSGAREDEIHHIDSWHLQWGDNYG